MTSHPGRHLALALSLCSAIQVQAAAQVATQTDDATDLRAAIAIAKGKVYPALVNIKVVARSFSAGRTVRSLSSGSGTVIDRDGHVLTNYHVARDAVRITCTMPSGEQFPADVVGHDAPTDVSVLKLRLGEQPAGSKPLPFARLGDSDGLQVGDMVLAVGNPLSLSSSLTLGVVSNTRRVFVSGTGNDLQELDFGGGNRTGLFTVWIQHDALILPGNSGGPLVDLRGDIIGINTRGGTGYGFASPANLVKGIVKQILAHGEVQRGWLGASFQPVAMLGRADGALTASVVPGSPAAVAGLQPGDVVVKLNGNPVVARFVEEIPLLYGRIADLRPGSSATISFESGDQTREAQVEVAPMAEFVGREVEMRELGVTLQDITAPMAWARGYPDTAGAVVTGLRAGEPFEEAKPKLRSGDVVVKVAGAAIQDIAALQEAFAGATARKIPVEFRRGRQSLVSVVEIDDKNPRQRGGELAKAWLGVRTQVLMPAIATAVGLEGQAGFRVTEVYPSTKAAAAGLQLGDVLVAIDDAPLKASRPQDERDLRNQVETHVIGEKVEFTVLRGGKKLAIEVELEQSPASAQDASKARSDAFELEVREMTRMDRITRDLPQDFAGVLVSEAASGGWAHIAGIASGQIILRLGGHAIDGPPAFKKAIQDMVGARPRIVPVFLRDGRRTVFRFIEPDWPNPNPPKQGSTEGPRNDKK